MKFRIIFEDRQILVVDKPTGLVVNRSQTIKEETLQDQLASYFHLKPGDLGIGDRAGIVHRLDRETSGILVVAKTQRAFDILQAQFRQRSIKKEYTALVHGRVSDQSGSIIGDIGRIGKFGKFGVVSPPAGKGRESRTDFKIIDYYKFENKQFAQLVYSSSDPSQPRKMLAGSREVPLKKFSTSSNNNLLFSRSRINYLKRHAISYTLLSLYPKTGRTHQVRVHLKSIGHAVVSDSLYAPAKLLKFDLIWCPRLFLHAGRIEFKMPKEGRIRLANNVVFGVPLPYDLVKACDYLERLPNG